LSPTVSCDMGQVIEIKLTDEQRQELEAVAARPSEGAGLVRRARVILLSDRGRLIRDSPRSYGWSRVS